MIQTTLVDGLAVRWTLIPVQALVTLEARGQEDLSVASPDEVFRGYLMGHSFRIPESKAWASSVAIAAVPFPPRIVPFILNGRRRSIVLPSPYYRGRLTRAELGTRLEHLLSRERPARVEEAPTVPYKLLAASCGLGSYGRNGLIHVEGLGTAHSLAVFWTSVPTDPVPSLSPKAHARCASCAACVRRCPTAAIPAEFGPIRVERCIPLWNELDRDLPPEFPPEASHALVGCVACQQCCPVDGEYLASAEEVPELSEAEVHVLLRAEWGTSLKEVLSRVLSSGDEVFLKEWAPVLARNFAAHLQAFSA